MKKSRSTRSHFTHARSCSRALNRVPARAKPPAFHPDVFVKRRSLQCSFMLFVIRGFDVLDSGVLGVISDLSALRIHLLSKWCMILDKIAALFVPRGDLVDFDFVGALLSTATSPSFPALLNRFSKSW